VAGRCCLRARRMNHQTGAIRIAMIGSQDRFAERLQRFDRSGERLGDACAKRRFLRRDVGLVFNEHDGDGAQRGEIGEQLQPALHPFDLAADARDFPFDGEDVLQVLGAGFEVFQQPLLLFLRVLDPRLQVVVFVGDVPGGEAVLLRIPAFPIEDGFAEGVDVFDRHADRPVPLPPRTAVPGDVRRRDEAVVLLNQLFQRLLCFIQVLDDHPQVGVVDDLAGELLGGLHSRAVLGRRLLGVLIQLRLFRPDVVDVFRPTDILRRAHCLFCFFVAEILLSAAAEKGNAGRENNRQQNS